MTGRQRSHSDLSNSALDLPMRSAWEKNNTKQQQQTNTTGGERATLTDAKRRALFDVGSRSSFGVSAALSTPLFCCDTFRFFVYCYSAHYKLQVRAKCSATRIDPLLKACLTMLALAPHFVVTSSEPRLSRPTLPHDTDPIDPVFCASWLPLREAEGIMMTGDHMSRPRCLLPSWLLPFQSML